MQRCREDKVRVGALDDTHLLALHTIDSSTDDSNEQPQSRGSTSFKARGDQPFGVCRLPISTRSAGNYYVVREGFRGKGRVLRRGQDGGTNDGHRRRYVPGKGKKVAEPGPITTRRATVYANISPIQQGAFRARCKTISKKPFGRGSVLRLLNHAAETRYAPYLSWAFVGVVSLAGPRSKEVGLSCSRWELCP